MMARVDDLARAAVEVPDDTDEKLTEQVSVRWSESMQRQVDQYIEARRRLTGITLSRALAIREILRVALAGR